MNLEAPHSFLIYRIELQFLSDFTNVVFPARNKHPCLLSLATVGANVTLKNSFKGQTPKKPLFSANIHSFLLTMCDVRVAGWTNNIKYF